MTKIIDLHTHSTASDGATKPEDIPGIAAAAKLSAIALTDHDTVGGVDAFLEAGKAFPEIEFIPGVEISAHRIDNGELHIVGLFIDHHNEKLHTLMDRVRAGRTRRNEQILIKLNSLGYEISAEELANVAGGDSVGRPHFARILLDKGYFDDFQTVFTKLLGRGASGYVRRHLPSTEETIATIHDAGGVAIWAHPVTFHREPGSRRPRSPRSFIRKHLKYLVPAGLDGIEAWYPLYTPQSSTIIQDVAQQYDLLVAGGSDYHGHIKPGLEIGTGFGDMSVPYDCLAPLKAR
jgi:3',5'-nucleoside bisphosphate phosphatase